jgi:hypothetical protein
MAVGATAVYFTNTDADTVMKVAKAGGAPVIIAPKRFSSEQPFGVAVTATHVYWISFFRSYIARIGLDGEDLTTLATGEGYGKEIAVDGSRIYWTLPGGIRSMSLAGGPAVNVAGGGVNQLAVDGTGLYWSSPGVQPSSGRIMKLGTGGGAPIALVSGLAGAGAIALRGSDVYYTDMGSILRVPSSGGLSAPIVRGHSAGALAVDGEGVYWFDTSTGSLMTAGLDGGTPRVLASGLMPVSRLSLDQCHLYWLDAAGGKVMKVAR